MDKSSTLFVGLDVHKDSIDIATAHIVTTITGTGPMRRWRWL